MQFLKQATFITLLVTLWSMALALPGCSTLPQPTQQVPAAPPPNLQASFLSVPLSFEANQGQTDPEVKFFTRGPGYGLFLTPNEAVLALTHLQPPVSTPSDSPADEAVNEPAVLRMHLIGANPTPTLAGETALPGKVNYFIGNDPNKWESNIPIYGRVRYDNVYPGIDLVYYGNQQQLEYDFVVGPGQDPQHIAIRFEGVTRLELDQNGDLLLLQTEDGVIRQQKPFIYQDVDGKRQIIDGGYVINTEGQVGFQVAAYDKSKPLIIDPILVFSTYLGGTGHDQGHGIAADHQGNVYVTGFTASLNFPTKDPIQPTNSFGLDTFVVKLKADGSALTYATYFGGSDNETASSIVVDDIGQIYVTGETRSQNFPILHAFQANHASPGVSDVFVVKLSADASTLIYSTFLGGFNDDTGSDIAVDSSGNAYVTGQTTSPDFPTRTPIQSHLGGGFSSDAFVTKLAADGSALIYSTYLGGSRSDHAFSMTVDTQHQVSIAGFTDSTDFPTMNPRQGTSGGGRDAFVAQLMADGSALKYSTYLGGSGEEIAFGVAIDASGEVHVTGETSSTNFPTKNPLQSTLHGEHDAFVVKLTANGSAFQYATYLGGEGQDSGSSITLDSSGNAWITGYTFSGGFPQVNSLAAEGGGFPDIFVAQILANGSALNFSTYLGGSFGDQGQDLALDSNGQVYITGFTRSTTTNNFFTRKPLQPQWGGKEDSIIVKINPQIIIQNGKFSPIGPNDVTTRFSRTPCGGNSAGTYTITATFTNISPDTLSNLVIHVKTLGQANVLCNADDGPRGRGALLTIPHLGAFADKELSSGESFTVQFDIGLWSLRGFQFLVDVLGKTD